MRWSAMISMACMCAVAGAAMIAMAQAGPPPALVRLDAAVMQKVEPMRSVTGELVPARRSSVASERDGQVIEVFVDRGSKVENGQMIARLDDTRARIELDRAEAQLHAAQAMVAVRQAEGIRADRDLSRTREMQRDNAVFSTEVEDRETDAAAAEARLRQARAELAAAQAMVADAQRAVDDMTIVAPFSGQVVAKLTEVGQWVREGDGVMEVIEISPIDAWLDVPEQFLAALLREEATTVQIVSRATAHRGEGRVSAVLAQGDALGRKFPVRVRLENEDGAFLPGMSITGMVPTGGSETVLTIHKDAVLRNTTGAYVYFDAGGVAEAASVEILYAVGDRFVVRSPTIQAGTALVVEGNERMFPGQPLNVIGSEATARGASGDGA